MGTGEGETSGSLGIRPVDLDWLALRDSIRQAVARRVPPSDVEDVTNLVCMRILQKAHDAQYVLRSWRRIARNCCFDELRRSRRSVRYLDPIDLAEWPEDEVPTAGLSRQLGGLLASCRRPGATLQNFIIEHPDWSSRAIARELGRSTGQVNEARNRLARRMRRKLEEA